MKGGCYVIIIILLVLLFRGGRGWDKLVPSAIHIHPYLYWLFIELMDKWTSPRQIKVEKTVIYSFSLCLVSS